ncbi:MBL fold metallo-hydrolase [Terracoccus luteus]|uniref:Glyoxylase-like metal-dependent hydrolase (Beta-lactamase superfamily II) n=1 Tax=Terracoccus luteus TaxID=53356 RepID=A0A839PUA4_9MICO|nr:MBL fold metallo-hydrolase [Terracoccus luteus]MBB2986769.1 glyoxylase-like metal-dependent hydrolase (beta-lactamase superfamily II) [Terracoccus luteus]MCP2172420.1 glyoxylase-like metal-dependent hydrolase (beta-lactamase superfamily II) [Terracoccus luteus]
MTGLSDLSTTPGGVRVEHTTTEGTFSLDGGTWDVENNVWVVGDDERCVVVDAPHDAAPILELVGERRLTHVLLTHAHDDHVTVVADLLAAHPGAVVALHPDDHVLWEQTHPDLEPGLPLADGDVVQVGDVELVVLHTPGHSPGAVCFHARDLRAVFTGDTLFQGGPGATGRSFSDFGTIVASIREKLLTLPPETVVLAGHGAATTIGAEAPDVEEWIRRGH